MNKANLTRRIAAILVALIMILPVSGCQSANEADTVNRFLSFLENAEYARIYQLLTDEAREKITLSTLAMRYDDIYRAFGLTSLRCELTAIDSVDETHKTARYTMAMATEKVGQFKLNMAAPLVKEGRKWLIDWSTELILPGLAEGDRAVLRQNNPSRGEIFDADGNLLAKNDHALSVYVDSSKVQNYETLIRMLAPKIGMTESEVRAKLKGMMKRDSAWTEQDSDEVPPQAEGVSGETPSPMPTVESTPEPTPEPSPSATAGGSKEPQEEKATLQVVKAYPKGGLTWDQQQELKQIPGVGVDDSTWTVIRYYPYGNLLAQTLGYTGVMTPEDQANPDNAGLPKDAVVGRNGLEKSFEKYLRGQPGYELYIEDADGNRKITLAKQAVTDGHDLRLTIDLETQQRAELMLRQYLTPEMAGTVIVMDPTTGYIEAMASAPSFDPNLFTFPVDPVEWKYLNDPVNMKPLINRATSALYPPGSTFKPFTASMGLDEGVISANFVFNYPIERNYWTPGDEFGVETPIKRAEATPGYLNLQNAIIHSDNIYFAYTALKMGGTKFYQHCLDLGLGLNSEHRMKFDLSLGASSITNSGVMDDQRRLADSGYGQGELQITPLQMAALFGSMANDGDIMQPRIVQSISHTEGSRYVADVNNPPEVWRQGVVSKKNLNLLLPALKKVSSEGTAKDLNRYSNLKDLKICAKTGTAEIGNDKTREIAWIIGFTTEKMNRLVCVAIEVPAGEGGIRTEIAKRMFDLPPTKTEAKQD